MRALLLLLAGAAPAIAAPAPTIADPQMEPQAPQPPQFHPPSNLISRNLTHMSPLLAYAGDVEYVFAPPHTRDGTLPDDIASTHHILKEGASVEFNFSGSTFVINGWADDALLRVREHPLEAAAVGWGAPEAGRAEWWRFSDSGVHAADVEAQDGGVSERTLVAVLGDADDGPRRVRLEVTSGEVWLSRVITQTDVPPSDEWGAPHWPIFGGWRGVREYMGAEPRGIWRETYVDFAGIGIEQPVAWGLGSYSEPEDEDADFASVTLSPAPGASYLELRGATPLPSMGAGRYRVHVDPPVAGHSEAWHTVHPAGGPTPADIVLFSAALDATLAYTVTLELHSVGWHWASAWFLAEMGVQPMPRWIGDWGRVRRVLDTMRARLAIGIAVVVAVGAVVFGAVLARRKARKDDEERRPLLSPIAEADEEACTNAGR